MDIIAVGDSDSDWEYLSLPSGCSEHESDFDGLVDEAAAAEAAEREARKQPESDEEKEEEEEEGGGGGARGGGGAGGGGAPRPPPGRANTPPPTTPLTQAKDPEPGHLQWKVTTFGSSTRSSHRTSFCLCGCAQGSERRGAKAGSTWRTRSTTALLSGP
jgi:hypothetical protein